MKSNKVQDKSNNNAKLVRILREQGASQYCSFLLYPNLADKNPNSSKKENVSLPMKYIHSNEFIDAINAKNGLMFVGLNAAKKDDETTNKLSLDFQNMHDNESSRSNDYKTARMVRDANKGDIIKGSFVCDVMFNVAQTNLLGIEKVIDLLSDSLPYFKPKKKRTNFNLIPDIDFTKANIYIKNIDDLKRELDEVQSIKADLKNRDKYSFDDAQSINLRLMKVISRYNYDIDHTNGKLEVEKSKLRHELYNHIINYDIPAFIYLYRRIKPKKIICFGKNAYDLVKLIKERCQLDSKIYRIHHFARSTRKEMTEDINKIL